MQDPRQFAYAASAAPAATYQYAAVSQYYGRYPQAAYGYPQQYNAAPSGGRGRGGYGAPVAYAPPYGGYGGYGAGYDGMRPRRKRAFVGGSLETQRQWEQSTLCCFSVEGGCKFGTHCRFSHEDDGHRPCQFGAHCRVGHGARGASAEQTAAAVPPAPAQQQ